MIDFNMKDFISKKLEIPIEQAFKIQKNFYKKYGTTLFGLMKYYDIDPDEFLAYVHNIDFSKLKKNDELNQYLKLLPGKKIVFTNGDENYASKVLCSLGIIDNIDEIYEVKKKFEKVIFNFLSTEIEWQAINRVSLKGEESQNMIKFLETLEEEDDVQNVYTNVNFEN